MIWYILFVVLTLVSLYGLWLLFKKAGKQGWEAIVPFYREYIFAELSARPKWWIVWLIVPIVNIFIFFGLYFDFLKCFGRRRFWETAAAVLVPFIVLPLWGRDPSVKYLGQSGTEEFKKKYPYKKSVAREWADAIIFATIAASLIRSFLIEPYVIPTGSMERSLLVGDFLFVSKLNYGPRVPMTPLAFPFAHHTMPLTGGKAYSEWIKIPYKRLPGFQEIKRNDVIVFNYPMDADPPYNRPVDKRENYIKRCVGMPGDILEMKDTKLFVNGAPGYDSNDMQQAYQVLTDGSGLNIQLLIEKRFDYAKDSYTGMPIAEPYILYVTEEEIAEVKQWTNVKEVIPYSSLEPAFPDGQNLEWEFKNKGWNFHNFGPLQIPKAGDIVSLTAETLPIYQRLITVYEGNQLERRNDGIYINGQKSETYEVKMNYYWMMGDNRDNSLDSRQFGFVPEDHIVGKALFTFMSWDEHGSFLTKVRWNRVFRGIK